MWVPSPVSCPGGATPPPPVDDRSGDLVSGACTGALHRAHTPCTGRRGWSAAASSIFASRDRPVVRPPRCALGPHPAGQRRSRRRGVAGRQRRPADAGGPGRRPQGHRGLRQRQQAARHLHPLRPGQGRQPAGLQRPRAARPGVGRERAEVHRRRAGPAAERVLRRRIDQARFFVGGIQDPLDAKEKAGSRSIQQLDAALNLLADPELAADAGPSRPVFNA